MLALDYTIVDVNDNKKVIHRRFEVKHSDKWVETPIDKIAVGDIFRMFDGDKLVVDQKNYSEFRAMSNVRIDASGYKFIHYTVSWSASNRGNLKDLKKRIQDNKTAF